MASLLRLESAAAMSYEVRSNLTFTWTRTTIIEQRALNVLTAVYLKSFQRAVNRLRVYRDLLDATIRYNFLSNSSPLRSNRLLMRFRGCSLPRASGFENALPEKSVIGLLLCAPSVFSVPLWLFFLSNR